MIFEGRCINVIIVNFLTVATATLFALNALFLRILPLGLIFET